MNTSERNWPGFQLATLIITYRCPISCPMCFLGCGPYRTEVMDESMALSVVTQVANLNIPFLGLTGGEPLCERRLLRILLDRALELGLKVILVTNGYWATSPEAAYRVLSDLKQHGLRRVQVSLDDQHQQWIPIERIANVARTALALDYEDVKLLGSTKGNSEKFKYQLLYLQELLGVDLKDLDLIDRPRVSTATFLNEEQRRYEFENLSLAEEFSPKDCLTQMMVDVDGKVYPCCNNFVGSIGNIKLQTLDEIVRSCTQNEYWNILWATGPTGLAVHLDAKYCTDFCQQRYESWCGLCGKIFREPQFSQLLQVS